jgi:hypothetical protein
MAAALAHRGKTRLLEATCNYSPATKKDLLIFRNYRELINLDSILLNLDF